MGRFVFHINRSDSTLIQLTWCNILLPLYKDALCATKKLVNYGISGFIRVDVTSIGCCPYFTERDVQLELFRF